MRTKKRKTNDSISKRVTRKKLKKEDEVDQSDTKIPSGIILPQEKHYSDDHVKTRLSLKVEEKNSKIVLPKVKITCVPLNVEKIIDFDDNNVILNPGQEIESNSEKKFKKGAPARRRKSKNECNQIATDSSERFSSIESLKQRLTKTRNKVKEAKKISIDASPFSHSKKRINDQSKKINSETLNGSQLNCRKQLVFNSSCSKEMDLKSPNQSYGGNTNNNLNDETIKAQAFSDCLPLNRMNDESVFPELSKVNFEEKLENVSNETLKIKVNENLLENDTNVLNNVLNSSNSSPNFNNSINLRCTNLYELEENSDDWTSQSKISLQIILEKFLSNSQLKSVKEISTLKKGLCSTWLSNNYVCDNQQCFYSHCAVRLFTKKMRSYSTKSILNIVVSMTSDILFVDAIMAALKILSTRKIPVAWVTFLIYFVFYATEPSDSRFLKFWTNAARFYCQLSNEYAAAHGFASLLAVFSSGEKSEEWKIIEFIKVINQPPIQVSICYELLQPVLKLDLPSQFLIDAVESCIDTQKDVLKVYLCIIPKISLMTSPIQTIELLLKFSKILEDMDLISHAENLKQRLLAKVKSFKTKVTRHEYPLTAAFQEGMFLDLRENEPSNMSEKKTVMKRQSENIPLEAINYGNKYFQLKNNFCNLIIQTLELTFAAEPCVKTSLREVKSQSFLCDLNNEVQRDDISEGQIKRIRQFFCDCQFDLLGKYLNDLKSNILEQAAEEFLKFLFQMKISLQQGVDLIKIILLQCKSDAAAKVIASICITLILNLVRINEWEKAYTIVSSCQEKQVNLIEGKVFYFNEFNTVSQCRIALLLIEIDSYNGNYQRAMKLMENYLLFSSNSSLWKLTWKPYDETIRIRIVEDFLKQLISKQATEILYNLFVSIWQDQKQLNGAVDLRKFVNEVIILLLNEGNEEALTLYENVEAEVHLNDTTIRAVLVTLVKLNRLSAAKSILISTTQNVYSLPHVTSGCATLMISSFWLEEEIYIVFETFLELLAAKKRNMISNEFENLEINIQILKPNFISPSRISPLCLGIINPAYKDACNRIQRVLHQRFSSPLKLIIMPGHLKLDEYSLQVHLCNRV